MKSEELEEVGYGEILGLSLLVGFLSIATAVAIFQNRGKTGSLPSGQPGLEKFSSYRELHDFVRAGSLSGEPLFFGNVVHSLRTPVPAVGGMGAVKWADSYNTLGESASPSQSHQHSTTNVQVEGVDEADIIKNDGKFIYALTSNKLLIVDAYPPENAEIVSELRIEGNPKGLFLSGDKLTVLGKRDSDNNFRFETFVEIYDIADRSQPEEVKRISVDGNYFRSRMIGDQVYVIANQFVNSENVRLPQVRWDNQSETVSASEVRHFSTPVRSPRFTIVLSVNVRKPGEFTRKVYLTGGAQNLYVSLNNVYITGRESHIPKIRDEILDEVLAPSLPPSVKVQLRAVQYSDLGTTEKWTRIGHIWSEFVDSLPVEEREDFLCDVRDRASNLWDEVRRMMERTTVHRISISEGEINYEARGEVPGRVLNQFSMDEHDGYFRIATTMGHVARTAGAATAKNHVYVLDDNLDIVGRLENLAPGERIYSARFMGDRAYLVTFRKVDPLFVVDLENPRNPEVLGRLKIPGFSNYLHPLDENHLIGIGKSTVAADEADFSWYQGVKIAIFDVSDVSDPKQESKFIVGDRGTESLALREHKAFLFSRSKSLMVIPITLAEIDEGDYGGTIPSYATGEYTWQGAYVFNISAERGLQLRGRISHIDDEEAFLKSGFQFRSRFSVKRSMYIENVLYTLSRDKLKMNDLEDLEEIKELEFPSED